MASHRSAPALFLLLLSLCFLIPVQANAQGISINGYFQQWYVIHKQDTAVAGHPGLEQSTSGFGLRRARFIVRAALDDVFSAYTLLDLAQRDRILLDATIRARLMPELSITVGQMMAPAQMYETSMLLTSNLLLFERSDIALQLSRYSGYDSFRDVGVMVSGDWSILRYGIYAGNGLGRFSSASSTFFHRRWSQGLFGGRVDLEPVKGVFLGGHAAINRQDSVTIGTRPTTSIAATTPPSLVTTTAPDITSRERRFASFRLAADGIPGFEELVADFEYGQGELRDGSALDFSGWYAQLGYWITTEVLLLGRYDTYEERLLSAPTSHENANVTGGVLWFYRKDGKEIVRLGVDYQWRKESPVDARNDILVAWMQIRF